MIEINECLSIANDWLFFYVVSFLCCPILCLCVLSSVFVMSVTIDFLIQMVRLYLQLFVGGRMSYFRYLCLLTNNGAQHILCCIFVFVFLCLVSSVLPVSLDCPFFIELSVFSNIYFMTGFV